MKLVRYIEDNIILGFVKNEEMFNKWLKANNKRRKEEGAILENKNEFELEDISNLEEEI